MLFKQLMEQDNTKNLLFAERLRQLRMQKGFSQRAFTKAVNLNYSQYNRYERGDSVPSTDTLTKLADALNVSVDYLLEGKEENAAIANLSDRELLRMFERAEKLPEKDKEHVKALLSAFLKNKEMENLMAAS